MATNDGTKHETSSFTRGKSVESVRQTFTALRTWATGNPERQDRVAILTAQLAMASHYPIVRSAAARTAAIIAKETALRGLAESTAAQSCGRQEAA